MTDKTVLNEEEGGGAAPANVTGGVAGKENSGNPPARRKELEDAVARAKESAHRMVKMKDKQ
jgi:hypothetical protein